MKFLEWISVNWQAVCAWVTGIAVLIRAGKYVAQIAVAVVDFFRDLSQAKITLGHMATNHLPHLQTELEGANEGIADLQISQEKTNEILTGLREDISGLRDDIRMLVTRHLSKGE